MIQQFFFGSTDSPLYMFHHALGAVLILIFTCFFIAIIINWISTKRKTKSRAVVEKNSQKEKPKPIAEINEADKLTEKPAETAVEITEEKKVPAIEINSLITVIQEAKQPSSATNFEIPVFKESVCNMKEHLFQFTEILLNKKLTEPDWDKRIPESALLDHRNYHRIIYLLINLNPDLTQTISRFKLVLETTTEVAINHQIYFRNWMMSHEMISAFKTGNEFSSIQNEISKAVKIAEQKNWKLQASSSELGTMINLLMKLSIKNETTDNI